MVSFLLHRMILQPQVREQSIFFPVVSSATIENLIVNLFLIALAFSIQSNSNLIVVSETTGTVRHESTDAFVLSL